MRRRHELERGRSHQVDAGEHFVSRAARRCDARGVLEVREAAMRMRVKKGRRSVAVVVSRAKGGARRDVRVVATCAEPERHARDAEPFSR
jgi:hypothetical protein